MSKTLEELRAALARLVGMFHDGTADEGSKAFLIDLDGLAHITEDNALNGGLVLITGAGAAAPEDEYSRISDYIPPVPSTATNLISNGGFETAGVGGADVFADWVESAGDGAIDQDGFEHAGDFSCKLTAGATTNTVVQAKALAVEPDEPYLLKMWHFATMGTPGRYSIWDVSNGGFLTGHGVTALEYVADWNYIEIPVMMPEGTTEIELWLYCPDADGDISYFDEVSLARCGGIYFAAPLTAEIEDGDTYEVYRAPLSLDAWDQAINQAIASAWPQVFSREMWKIESAEVSDYLLPDDATDVLEVAVAFRGQYHGLPSEPMTRNLWRVDGLAGTDLILHLHRIVPAEGRDLNVYYKAQYPELAAGESTDLDSEYLMLASAGRLYHMLAAEAGPQASSSRYLQLLQYYDGQAQERLDLLEADLMGVPIETRWQKKKAK